MKDTYYDEDGNLEYEIFRSSDSDLRLKIYYHPNGKVSEKYTQNSIGGLGIYQHWNQLGSRVRIVKNKNNEHDGPFVEFEYE